MRTITKLRKRSLQQDLRDNRPEIGCTSSLESLAAWIDLVLKCAQQSSCAALKNAIGAM